VNDYAGLLGPVERQRLETRLAEGERATGAQVVVAIFRSLEGESLEDYSIRLAQQWRIGRKGFDNGAILLVFVAERKVRLEIGYGLEAAIPDAVAGQIIRERLAPRFREGQYARGLDDAVAAVFARAAAPGAAREPGVAPQRRPAGLPPALAIAVAAIIGAIVVVILMDAMGARRFARRNGYTAGRGGRWSRPGAGTPPIFWGGGFGGSGGGGFSGGGGGFGGGGASGDW
jgi:uncharacterized protein